MGVGMKYQEILQNAWNIIWKHKILWIFGILAGCTSNRHGISYNSNSSSWNHTENLQSIPPQVMRTLHHIQTIFIHPLFWGGLLLFFILVILLRLYLGTTGNLGIILGTKKAKEGAERLSFGELWSGGTPYFWRYLGAWLISTVPFFVIGLFFIIGFLILLLPMLFHPRQIQGGMVALWAILASVGILVLSLLALAVRLFMNIALNALVLEDLEIRDAFRRGWEVFRPSFLEILLMAVILGAIRVIAGIIIALPLVGIILALIVPAAFASAFGGHISSGLVTSFIIGISCTLIYLPILLGAGGLILSYVQSAWTLTYLSLTETPERVESADETI